MNNIPSEDIVKPESIGEFVERATERLSGYIERVNAAFGLWRIRAFPAKPTQDDLALAVASISGEKAGQNSASRWLKGSIPRDFETMRALPLALGVDPGWLYFGSDSAAPGPQGYVAQQRAEEPEGLAAARRHMLTEIGKAGRAADEAAAKEKGRRKRA